ncbi:MAG: ATP-dependent DNA helicase RecG [candidate division WOR-3 bacterium]|nr:ATP-dependent DNA helicase RecG [candidate division WOR-3 bacterium]
MQITKPDLSLPVQYLKGIGPKKAKCLKKLNIQTIEDFLFFIPRRYVDRSNIVKIRELKLNSEGTIFGRIQATNVKLTKTKGILITILVADDSGVLEAVWFNRPDLKDKFRVNQKIILSGVTIFRKRKQMINPFYEIIALNSDNQTTAGISLGQSVKLVYTGGIIPIYPLTEGITNWDIRRAMRHALLLYAHHIPETLPENILKKYNFPNITKTLHEIHFPQKLTNAQSARNRLIFEEFFYFELVLALQKLNVLKSTKGYILEDKGNLTKRFINSLPFNLTTGQQKVLNEIKSDMAKPRPMNRLLQGDVGSGKTVIAIYAMLIAIENGYQAALMAPTEILAEQHYFVWHQRLKELGVSSCLLTGSTKSKERKIIYEGISNGSIQLIFGTHALIEENVKFHKLGIAVVDEQHRFGVMQRAALLNKGINPDFLVMTATPIPRTLQLTLYGDLDISHLTEKPPGRKKIITRLVDEKYRTQVYQFIKESLVKKKQIYIVCPLIEESEKTDLRAAIKTYEEVQKIFQEAKVGLIHGRLKSEERIKIMEDFRSQKLDILVTTTVIEVGVDIPNASVMIIEHPERFGLSQLHQLRGRIGRGTEISYCILITSISPNSSAYDRLKFFESNDDGFLLAEKDLEIRGPGEIFGTRQHGLPDFRFADLKRDQNLLFKARDAAFELIENDPRLENPTNYIVRKTFISRFKNRIDLLRVG